MKKVDLIADEIYNYFCHLALLSKINEKSEAEVSKYSALSFGTPASAKCKIVTNYDANYKSEVHNIYLCLDFSSLSWFYDFDNIAEVDIHLDSETQRKEYFDYMRFSRGYEEDDYVRLLDIDFVDFEELKNVLMKKYGISFSLFYDEKSLSEDVTIGSRGSDYSQYDKEYTVSRVYYIVNSFMNIEGRVYELNNDEQIKLIMQ